MIDYLYYSSVPRKSTSALKGRREERTWRAMKMRMRLNLPLMVVGEANPKPGSAGSL